MPYDIDLLGPHHDRTAFSCGEPSLDIYIERRAGQDMRRDLAACYVLCERGNSQVIGYYTLSAASVQFTDLPEDIAKKSGRYHSVPALLLGRLAVDIHFQGQGSSTLLLMDALRRSLRTGVGVKLVIVDALNQRAADFYERREFRRFADASLRLFMPISRIRLLFPDAGAPSAQ